LAVSHLTRAFLSQLFIQTSLLTLFGDSEAHLLQTDAENSRSHVTVICVKECICAIISLFAINYSNSD